MEIALNEKIVNILIIYAPTDVSELEALEKLFIKLSNNMKAVDFNSKLSAIIQKYGKGTQNEGGTMLLEAMVETNHVATNTRFRQKFCNITRWNRKTKKENMLSNRFYTC